ncbi:Alpha/Beta hydrolase protein [Fimicolochytrium jonesii]|uniref:Alpha/Beta hydrolase protein n=1 Tax=Fimicolochytrium jonesii TaxID=1396493 RepID=UPI0022FE9E3A|nr:Alpha/Beta hydrolase protein [Fimicolochytrium jonesii]KAI8825840.1 Alpha/Beta hydrolase protein [Fimicolochytrium jonesii]
MAVITPTKTAKGINGFKGSNGVRDGGLQTRLPNATPTTTANVLDIAPPADGEHSSADNGICPLPIRAPRLPSKPASKHTFRPRVYSSHFPHPKAPTTEQAIKSIPNLHSAQDLIEFWKYPGEAHSVETKDGYILGLYRIPNPQHGFTAYTAPTPYKRPPVIIWHGLCISSNAFLCSPGGTDTNLALYLASEGFDVWLANSRGSRASRRHAKMPSPDEIMFHSKYWKYVGMDEMAKFDVPAVVDYVIAATGWKKVGYVGFSQGTAQMFMSLSMSEEMNSKIAFFAALAPAMKPKGMRRPKIANRVLTRLTSYSPSLLFVMGCWSALPTAEWLRGRLFNKGYAQVIHSSLEVLMGWKNNKFPKEWWPALYMHLFAGGSVRNIVHWFQIITEQNFAPYDHEIAPHHLLPSHSSSRSKPPSLAGATLTHSIPTFAPTRTGPCPYPTQHITVPMRLFCGTEDNISAEPAVFKQSLPEARIETVEGYEHMVSKPFLRTDTHIR